MLDRPGKGIPGCHVGVSLPSVGAWGYTDNGRVCEVIIVLIGAVVAALVLGYLAGLWSFKAKNRWCAQCGTMTTDPISEHIGHAR